MAGKDDNVRLNKGHQVPKHLWHSAFRYVIAVGRNAKLPVERHALAQVARVSIQMEHFAGHLEVAGSPRFTGTFVPPPPEQRPALLAKPLNSRADPLFERNPPL